MKILLALTLLINLQAYAKNDPTPEKACQAFKNAKKAMEQMGPNYEQHKKTLKVLGALYLAISANQGLRKVSTRRLNEKLLREFNDIEGITPAQRQVRRNLGLPERKLSDSELKDFSKGVKKENLKTALKGLKKFGVIGTVVTVGQGLIDFARGKDLKEIAKEALEDFAPKVGDGTLTAHYASNPEVFMDLEPEEACRHMSLDEESPSAEDLRKHAVALEEFFKEDLAELVKVVDPAISDNGRSSSKEEFGLEGKDGKDKNDGRDGKDPGSQDTKNN